jgi:non-specific serine/threonine protein kinase
VKKRGELVERFNGAEYVPYMVLSLKAGGVGLNLTSANHVVHFDRWWNPAVENQATDRAFRIGQQKNVCVHKFVTTGTIEEKIDIIIENKQKMAGDVISATSGENWITEMNNKELFNLFRLGV